MIGFEIALNGSRICVASAGDTGVLSACVTWVLRTAPDVKEPSDLRLDIGGLSEQTHLKWPAPRKLQVGDQVLVKVVETATPDPPERTQRDDVGLVEAEERKYYERLKAKYERS